MFAANVLMMVSFSLISKQKMVLFLPKINIPRTKNTPPRHGLMSSGKSHAAQFGVKVQTFRRYLSRPPAGSGKKTSTLKMEAENSSETWTLF